MRTEWFLHIQNAHLNPLEVDRLCTNGLGKPVRIFEGPLLSGSVYSGPTIASLVWAFGFADLGFLSMAAQGVL